MKQQESDGDVKFGLCEKVAEGKCVSIGMCAHFICGQPLAAPYHGRNVVEAPSDLRLCTGSHYLSYDTQKGEEKVPLLTIISGGI